MREKTLFDLLSAKGKALSATHGQIAEFLLKSGHKAALLTAAEIAAGVGASESTVVRFARIMGFDGFPEFQQFLQQGLLDTLSPVDRLAENKTAKDRHRLVEQVGEREISNLRAALNGVDVTAIEMLADAICSAQACYVIGLRSSRPLAALLGHYLKKIVPRVDLIASSDFMLEELSWASAKDVLIAYSFPRYSKPTIEAIRVAKSAGARTAVVTDSRNAPACQLSDVSLIAPSISYFYGNSFVSAVAITNLLLAFCVQAKPVMVRRNLGRVEKLASLTDRFFRPPNEPR